MDYEKKYKEALDRAKAINEGKTTGNFGETVSEYIFPELKESEDERIRKALVNLFKYWGKRRSHCWSISIPKILAWLEKQGDTIPEECIFRPIVGCDIKSAVKQAIEKQGVLAKNIVLAFNGFYTPIGGKAADIVINEYNSWCEKQGEQSIHNIPSRETILAIWDLGNEWKELTHGNSTKHGTQLAYIQKHWQARNKSEYWLKEKQGEQKPFDYENVENCRKV